MEFKRLSDVEVVAEPTESANVLIEEDGVIKKAPKTVVGGGEPDMVINIKKWTQTIANEGITASDVAIEDGSITNVFNALGEGRMPVIKIRHYEGNEEVYGKNYAVNAEEYACCYISKYDMYCEIYYMNMCGVSRIAMNIEGDTDVLLSYQLGPNLYLYSSTGEVPLV